MDRIFVLLILACVFLLLLALGVGLWLLWIRPYVMRCRGKAAPPYFFTAALTDFMTACDIYRRRSGVMPWFLKMFALLLALLVSIFVLIAMLLVRGTR